MKRISSGLKPLAILPLPLLKDYKLNVDYCAEEDIKISSSNYRMRLLGSLLKPPTVIEKLNYVKSFNNIFCCYSQKIISVHVRILSD